MGFVVYIDVEYKSQFWIGTLEWILSQIQKDFMSWNLKVHSLWETILFGACGSIKL
jgi:hypothetical protein